MTATDTTTAPQAYRFGPRETRGVILGLRGGQLALLLAGAGSLVAGLSAGPAGAVVGLVVLAVMAAAAFLPVAGRTPEQWFPALVGYLATGRGRTLFQPHPPDDDTAALDLPGAVAGLVMTAPAVDQGRTVAVVHDPRAATLTAVAAVRGSTFALADSADKDRRVAAWGSLLAGLARDGSPVRRVAWLERTLPDPGALCVRLM